MYFIATYGLWRNKGILFHYIRDERRWIVKTVKGWMPIELPPLEKLTAKVARRIYFKTTDARPAIRDTREINAILFRE